MKFRLLCFKWLVRLCHFSKLCTCSTFRCVPFPISYYDLIPNCKLHFCWCNYFLFGNSLIIRCACGLCTFFCFLFIVRLSGAVMTGTGSDNASKFGIANVPLRANGCPCAPRSGQTRGRVHSAFCLLVKFHLG